MTEQPLLVLRPYSADETAEAEFFGVTRIQADCGHESWISPSSRDLMATQEVATACTSCMPDDPVDARRAPGAREELIARLGSEEAADKMIEAARTLGKVGLVKEFLVSGEGT